MGDLDLTALPMHAARPPRPRVPAPGVVDLPQADRAAELPRGLELQKDLTRQERETRAAGLIARVRPRPRRRRGRRDPLRRRAPAGRDCPLPDPEPALHALRRALRRRRPDQRRRPAEADGPAPRQGPRHPHHRPQRPGNPRASAIARTSSRTATSSKRAPRRRSLSPSAHGGLPRRGLPPRALSPGPPSARPVSPHESLAPGLRVGISVPTMGRPAPQAGFRLRNLPQLQASLSSKQPSCLLEGGFTDPGEVASLARVLMEPAATFWGGRQDGESLTDGDGAQAAPQDVAAAGDDPPAAAGDQAPAAVADGAAGAGPGGDGAEPAPRAAGRDLEGDLSDKAPGEASLEAANTEVVQSEKVPDRAAQR